MPLVYNGVTVTDVIYNGVALDKVIYNGVTVFEKAPAIIREPASGEYYTNAYLQWVVVNGGAINLFWNSGTGINFSGASQTFISYNGYTYYRGSYKTTKTFGASTFIIYGIYRIKN